MDESNASMLLSEQLYINYRHFPLQGRVRKHDQERRGLGQVRQEEDVDQLLRRGGSGELAPDRLN